MRILLADDHDLLRDALEMYLERENAFDVCGVGDLDAALALLHSETPFDLVLLDVDMPGMNGLDGLKRTLDAAPDTPVTLISGTVQRAMLRSALELGAAGFLPKSMPAGSLAHAIRFMAAGQRYVPVELMFDEDGTSGMTTGSEAIADRLTERERDVLRGLCEGLSNKAIARNLDLSEATIKLHVKTLYRRLGVANRTQAALLGRQAGLVGACRPSPGGTER